MVNFTHKLLSFLLIVQLVIPTTLQASNDDPSYYYSYYNQENTEFEKENQNLFKLLSQTLRSNKDSSTIWDLSSSNLVKPEVFTSIVEFRNLKHISFTDTRIDISYESSSYIHSIDIGTPIKDVISDDDFIVILTTDGKLHVIDVYFLSHVIFCAPCPVFTISSIEDISDISTISFIKRRFIPLDQRISIEHLSLSSKKNSVILANDTPVDLDLLKSEFNSIKFIPLSDELKETTPVLQSGDLAIIRDSKISEIIPRTFIVSEMNRFLLLYVKFQSLVLEPSFQKALSSMGSICLEDITKMFPAYLESATIHEEKDDTSQILDHSYSARTLSEFRDIFTPKEWEDDSIFFTTLLSSVENKPESLNSTPKNKLKYMISTLLHENIISLNIVKFASMLKNKYTLGFLIFLVSALSYIKMFPNSYMSLNTIEYLSTFIDHSKSVLMDTFPVLKNQDYMKLLSYSMVSQILLMFSIYFVARLISPFTQYKSDTLPPLVGSKIFKNLFMVSPFRLIAKLTGNIPIFTGLKKGVLPDSDSFGLTKEAKKEGFSNFRQKIESIRMKNFVINTFLTRSLIILHRFKYNIQEDTPLDEKELLADLSDPYIKQAIGEIHKLLSKYLDQFDFKDKDYFISSMKEAHSLLLKLYSSRVETDLVDPDQNEVEDLIESDPKLNFNPKSSNTSSILTTTLIRLIFNYNEKIYKTISQIAPNSFTSSITKRQFFTNYTLSMLGQAFTGNFADPTKPEDLMAQRNSAFYTSSKVNTFNFQKIIGHIGKGPIATNLIFKEEAKRINREYYPAEFIDIVEHDMNFKNYPFWYEMYKYGRNIFNFREAEPGKLLVRWLLKSYITLFQATILIGVIFRIFVGHQSVHDAILGIFMFSASSSFICNWPWTLLSAAQYIHDNDIKAKYKTFVLEFIKLKQSRKLSSTEEIKELADYFYNLYSTTHINIPKDIKKSIIASIQTILDSNDPSTILDEATNLEKLIQRTPGVPRSTSEWVSFIYTAVASLSSAFLLSFLITQSFSENLHLWGISKSIFDINFFTHIPNDGVIPLVIKSAVLTTLVFSAQDLFNLAYDYIKYLLTPYSSPKKEERKTKLESTKEEFKRTPVMKILGCVFIFSKKD